MVGCVPSGGLGEARPVAVTRCDGPQECSRASGEGGEREEELTLLPNTLKPKARFFQTSELFTTYTLIEVFMPGVKEIDQRNDAEHSANQQVLVTKSWRLRLSCVACRLVSGSPRITVQPPAITNRIRPQLPPGRETCNYIY
ncbi:hypothetical protein J6590_009910 [Homalodisca vitripennis]|nr:hypothetical protein J6590_009910 [Homalodisca vitripennis]